MLGILLMNAVSFKFGPAPYFNLSASGSDSWLDWAVGIIGEVIVDQKFMGLFSLLFGAGMILFIDRASRRGRRAVVLTCGETRCCCLSESCTACCGLA